MENSVQFYCSYTYNKCHDKEDIFDLIHRIESSNYDIAKCESSVVSLAYNAMTSNNTDLLADILDSKACECIINCIRKYGVKSKPIASLSCLVVGILSYSSLELREYFGTLEACELIIFTASMHYGDDEISEFSTLAIRMLTQNNISNSYHVAEADGCEVITQVGVFGFNLQNKHSTYVTTNVMYIICQLSEAINVNRLLDCGACDLIVKLLRIHENKNVVVTAAMKALSGLASLNIDLRESLGRSGLCEIIAPIINKYNENTTILQDGCEVIMHLSLGPTNVTKLSSCSAIETLLFALDNKLLDEMYGAEVCSGALLNMVLYGVTAKENRSSILSLNGVAIIRKILLSSKAGIKCKENTLQLLDILGADRVVDNIGNSSNNFVGIFHASEYTPKTKPLAIDVYESFEFTTNEFDSSTPSLSKSNSTDSFQQLRMRCVSDDRTVIL